jgi:hypothetical protein
VTDSERDELIRGIARCIAELLESSLAARAGPAGGELVDAANLAQLLGVSRDFVYDHAAELGAIPLSDTGRPRLRFNPDIARATLAARSKRATKSRYAPANRTRQRPRSAPRPPLLPIRGERTG